MEDHIIRWELEITYVDNSYGYESPHDTIVDDTLYTDKEDAYKTIERLDAECETSKEFSLIDFTLSYSIERYNGSQIEHKESWDIYDFRKWREENDSRCNV